MSFELQDINIWDNVWKEDVYSKRLLNGRKIIIEEYCTGIPI
ncbi:hypothetical protein [Enterocloster bolteae]|nr:hypothetical protein [Enterocloster bolteae]